MRLVLRCSGILLDLSEFALDFLGDEGRAVSSAVLESFSIFHLCFFAGEGDSFPCSLLCIGISVKLWS